LSADLVLEDFCEGFFGVGFLDVILFLQLLFVLFQLALQIYDFATQTVEAGDKLFGDT